MNNPSTLTWLHLSDTHLGNPNFDWNSKKHFKALMDDLKCARDRYDLRPDLIFFTGDLVFGYIGKKKTIKKQYDKFFEVLDDVRNIFDPIIPKKAIFIVPGNHDVNRQKVTIDQTKWLLECSQPQIINDLMYKRDQQWLRYIERLASYRQALSRYKYNHLLQDLQRLWFSREIQVGDILISISGINTAWSSSGDREKGKLWLGLWQLDEVINKSQNADIKILLCHHPSNWLNEYEENRVSRRIELNFDFLLHGHEHKDWVTRIDHHVKISGGTCYEAPEKETGYNITQILFRENRAKIFLRSFDETGGGWIPKIFYKKTSQDGIWTLNNLPLVGEKRLSQNKRLPRNQTIPTKIRKGIDIYNYFTVAKAQDNESLFVGRREELAKGIGVLKAEGASIAIYGKAGVGKSSLAIQLGHIASGGHNKLLNSLKLNYEELPDEGFNLPVVYYSCDSNIDKTIPDVFISLLLDKAGPLNFGILLDSKRIKDELMKPSNEMTFGQIKKIYDFGRTPETMNIAEKLFTNIAYLISKLWNDSPLTIVLDEFDVIADKKGFASHMKNNPFIKYIISGTATDVVLLVQEHASVPRQIAEGQILVSKMDEDECGEIINKEIARSRGQFTFTPDAIKQLSESARGMPFFVHFFGRYSVAEAIKRTKSENIRPLIITESDVSSAMERRLKDLADLDAKYLDIIQSNWQKETILNLLSFRRTDDFNIRDIYFIADKLGITKQACSSFARTLMKKGIITKMGPYFYEFLDTRIKVFARLRRPITDESAKKLKHFFEQEKMRESIGGWHLPPNFKRIKSSVLSANL